jgi:hypothetical protein
MSEQDIPEQDIPEQEDGVDSNLRNRNILKIAAITLLFAVLVLLAIIGIRRLMPGVNDIRASVTPHVLSIKDSLFFKDNSKFASDWRWNFGDNTQAFSAEGYHRYAAPGNYTIQLLINGKYADTFLVSVTDIPPVPTLVDSLPLIEAPILGMQFENLVFRAKGVGASQYRWKFGETNFIDSKEPFVQYAYQQPGDYTVLLYTNNSEYPTRHQIKILPSFKGGIDTFSIDDMYRQYEDDFKFHLQQIANGSDFNNHYYYLLKKYLCQNEKAIIKVGEKVNDFNSYCLGLQFDEGVMIQSVKLTPQADLTCIKSVEVKQLKNQ